VTQQHLAHPVRVQPLLSDARRGRSTTA
jgi:hypothetical protein